MRVIYVHVPSYPATHILKRRFMMPTAEKRSIQQRCIWLMSPLLNLVSWLGLILLDPVSPPPSWIPYFSTREMNKVWSDLSSRTTRHWRDSSSHVCLFHSRRKHYSRYFLIIRIFFSILIFTHLWYNPIKKL